MSVLIPSLTIVFSGLVFIVLYTFFKHSRNLTIAVGILLCVLFVLYAANLICYVIF